MTLDDATRQVYRRTDSATLLALLPELRRLLKRTQKELDVVEQSTTASTEQSGDGDQEAFAAQLFAYSSAVEERERWIRDELKRRGLIPLWPGEQRYLADDS